MKQPKLNTYQSGVALILSLILLFVLTLVAVASFSSSNVQERAAGNVRLQTMAFEAAAAGANNAIEFFMTNAVDHAPDLLCGASNHEGWYDGDGNPILSPWIPMTYDVDGVDLKQRMYCLADQYPCSSGEPGCVGGVVRAPRSQLFVLSRGEVVSDGTVVAYREVEVRIDRGKNTWELEGCGAICFAACDYLLDRHDDPAIDFPSSNVFQVDGGGGPAVTASADCDPAPDPSLLNAILGDIKDSRLGNYDGGIHEQNPGEPWNDPDKTDAFRAAVETEAAIEPNLLIDASFDDSLGVFDEGSGVYEDNGNTVYGTVDEPIVTYVKGDLEFGGGISGAGIMMVEGNIAWNGTPDYKGLIVSLGGTYTIDGGGLGGNHAGSVVVVNNNRPHPIDGPCGDTCPDFGGISWLNTGGGTAEYNWDCDALTAAFALVAHLDPDGLSETNPIGWGFDCDRGPPTLFEAPGDLVVASWRENLGWRTDEFSAP
jgi:hypothetical protein